MILINHESLKLLSDRDYERLGIPARLANIMKQTISNSVQNQQRQNNHYNYNHNNYNQNKNQMEMDVQFDISEQLHFLKKRVNQTKFNELIDLILKIFINIKNNITQQKYRTLLIQKPKIVDILKYKQIVTVLQYGGFQQHRSFYIMKNINFGRIDQCINFISRQHKSNKFDPYKQQITSITGKSFDQITEAADSSVIYNEKLAYLQKQREKIMSKPIKNRQVRIFKADQRRSKIKICQFEQQKQPNQQEQIDVQAIKQRLKRIDQNTKFMNRRKQQYYDLMKKPCYSETIIRVKLPQDYIFEAKFSPLQPIQKLLQVFHQNVEDNNLDYYLYMTPPVQKIKGNMLRYTFYQINCVPSGMFFIGSQKQININLLKFKSNKLLEIF